MRIHFLIGKKDADIVWWIRNLPKKTFNHYIKLILQAEKNKTYAVIPVPLQKELMREEFDTTIRINDKVLTQFVRSFSKEGISNALKRIIRKHIEWNYVQQSKANNVNNTLIKTEDTEPIEVEDTVIEETSELKHEPVHEQFNDLFQEHDVEEDEELSEEYMEMLKKLSGE